MKKRATLTMLSCILCVFSFAQTKSEGLSQAATNALNPIAQVVKFMLQPNYYMYDNGGNALNLMTRIITPYKGILIPGINPKNDRIFSLARLEIPVTSQTYGSEPQLNATGLADMTLGATAAYKFSWGKVGVGINLGFPAATSPALGSGKWTAGPTAIIFYNKPKHVMLGLVVNQSLKTSPRISCPNTSFQGRIKKLSSSSST